MKYREFFVESLTDSYRYSAHFETGTIDHEDEDTGEVYKKDVLQPVQIVRFTGGDGTPYLWYARQDYHDNTLWTIAFGVVTGIDARGISCSGGAKAATAVRDCDALAAVKLEAERAGCSGRPG